MSSSRSRNFRRRGGDDNEDDDDTKPSRPTTTANGGTSSTTTASATARPKKPSAQPPKSLLSFADDADESPFTRPASSSTSRASSTIKPSSSHKLTSTKDRIAPGRPAKLSNVQPQAGTYTKEALLELQKNTKTLTGPRPAHSKPKKELEPVIVLKGLIKPVGDGDKHVDNEEKVEKSDDDEDDELGSEKKRDETTAQFRSMRLKGKGEDIGPGIIPDQATIDAIRAKRERMRQVRAAAPDFIALDSGSNHGEAEGLSDEEPEFQGRIGFFGDKIESGKKGVFEDFDDRATPKAVGVRKGDSVDEDEDEDEEDKMWEEEQVRKGLGKRIDDGATRGVSSTSVSSGSVAQSVQQQKFGYSGTGPSVYPSLPSLSVPAAPPPPPPLPLPTAGPNIGGAVGGFPEFDSMSIAQQAERAKKALLENVRRLKETHCQTTASLTKTDENLSASLTNVTVLEKSLTAAGEKYIFMQKLRDFVSVICEFLQDRAPYIEEVEAQLQKLHEERAVAIVERRAADQDDEMKDIEAAVNAAMSVLSKGGSSTAMLEAATNTAQAAAIAARELRDFPVELDEFGRDVNLQKRMDMKRRAEARKHRRDKSDSKRLSSSESDRSYQRIEGESSTDESDSESMAYQSNREQLLQVADQILGKADEEFAQLSNVIDRLQRWKKEYASTYRDAYMSLSAPAIFSPYVRLELLKWDPLHEDADFNNMKWHSLLFNYGQPEDDSKISADDADGDLVPELVEKLAIPILHHQLAYCWDVLSTRETKYAVSATNLVIGYVRLTSSALGKLVAVLHDRLSEAVDNLVIPTWNALVMNAVPNAARVAAYRFGMSIRLMRNVCLWNKILAVPVLEKLVLDELLSGKILPHMRSIQSNIHDAVTRSERIIASLHGVWTGPSIAGDRSPKLQPLVDYLLTLGRALEKKHILGVTDTETGKIARRLKKMLVDLNEYDHARAMSRTFNLKEAL